MKRTLFFLAISAILGGGAQPAEDLPRDAIRACLAGYGTLYDSDLQTAFEVVSERIQQNTCSDSRLSANASMDSRTSAIIAAVPTISRLFGSLGIQSNRQLCSFIGESRFRERLLTESQIRQNAEAQRNYNECIRAATNSGVIISHVVDPSRDAVTIYVDNLAEGRTLPTVVDSREFQCHLPTQDGNRTPRIVNGAQLNETHDLVVTCVRSAARTSTDVPSPDASITVSVNDEPPHQIIVPSDVTLGPRTRNESIVQIAELRRMLEEQARELTSARERRTTRWYVSNVDIPLSQRPWTPVGERFPCFLSRGTTQQQRYEINDHVCPDGRLDFQSIRQTPLGRVVANCAPVFYEAECISR